MTDAVLLKPNLGRFGAWLPTRSITPELAAGIESLGYGAAWIGGSPDAGLGRAGPRADHLAAIGHRDREYLVRAGTGRRGVL